MQHSGENERVRPPVPPFTEETARQKVKAAQDAWNTRNPVVAVQDRELRCIYQVGVCANSSIHGVMEIQSAITSMSYVRSAPLPMAPRKALRSPSSGLGARSRRLVSSSSSSTIPAG